MRLSTTLLSGLSLALGATAFLVPPQVSDEALAAANLNLDMDWDLDTLRDSLPDSVKSGQHVEVQLTPHERTPADTLSTTEVKKYDFGERLTLDFAAGDHAVYVNDIEIYPQPAQAPITVDRAFSLADGPGPAETLRLSTRMDFGKMGEKDESGISRLPCKLEVLGVEDMVLDFEVVEFDILEDLAGYTHIGQVTLTPSVQSLDEAECTTILCRARAQITAKLAALRAATIGRLPSLGSHGHGKLGCAGMHKVGPPVRGGPNKFRHGRPEGPGPVEPPMEMEEHADDLPQAPPSMEMEEHTDDLPQAPPSPPHHDDGEHHGPHHHGEHKHRPCHNGTSKGHDGKHHGHHGHHGKHGMRRFACMMSRALRSFVIPVLIGIAAGMAVSAMGLVIGHVFYMIWARVTGHRAAGYVVVEQEEGVADVEAEDLPVYEEKDGSALPEYEYRDEKTVV